jgi:hypothetical protein
MTMHSSFNLHDDIAWGPNGGRASDVPPTGKGPNPLEDGPADKSSEPPPLAPNRSDIAKHLYALFAPDFVHAYPDSWIEIAYGDPTVDEGKPNAAKTFSPFKLEEAIAFAEEKNRFGSNIYVGAALRHGERSNSGRASGHHVLAASHAWAEYEGAGDDERISAILKDKSLVPAIVLTTGTIPHPRRHLYFRLASSAAPDDVRAANAVLKKLLSTDNVQNPDRIMRLAGTVSYPPPKKKTERGYVTELVTLHQNSDARAYSLDELIGVAPGGRGRGYSETEEKPASTVESFFKDVNALALTRLSHWVKPLFGTLVRFYPATGAWRTTPEANKALDGRSHLEEAISISQRGVWDYGFEKPSTPLQLVKDYGPRGTLLAPLSAKDAALWLCQQMNIAPEALGWGSSRERRSADDAGYENGYDYDFGNAGAQSSSAGAGAAKGLNQTFFEDVEKAKDKRWITKGVIAHGETSSWIAPPGKGKSGLLTDLAIHVAQCKDWRGYKAKKKCGVVYFALERGDLVKRRLYGHKLRDGLEKLPISVVSGVLNLAAPSCKDIMLNTIREAEKHFGCRVGLIIIDPFAKGIAAGGGDEDKAKDQNITLANLRRLQEETDVHAAIVGHTGKDETRGARGSNAHVGDADIQIQVKGKGSIRVAEIIKANDQAEGVLTQFKLEVLHLGVDEDGDAITTAILSPPDDATAAPRKPDQAPLTAAERRAIEMLVRALNDEGKPPPSAAEYRRDISKIVPLDTWRDYCERGGLSSGESDGAFRKAFRRVHISLMNKQKIGCWDNNVWIAYHKMEGTP